MKTIPLTQGYETLVDDEDYEELSKHNWHICKTGRHLRGAARDCLSIPMARDVMNAPSHLIVDHKDGNVLNNQKENLRLCYNIQNLQNRRKQRRKTSSKYKGVSLRYTGKWLAEIQFSDVESQKVRVRLGLFLLEEEAAKAYDQAARYYHGEFAALNFPGMGEQSCL